MNWRSFPLNMLDVVDTAQQTKAKDVDVAENTKVEVSSDVENNINNDEYKENNSSEENVEVVSDVTADMNTTEITTPEELNPSLKTMYANINRALKAILANYMTTVMILTVVAAMIAKAVNVNNNMEMGK